MEAILLWGVDFIVTIQQIHGPMLDAIFRGVTYLGGEEFYLFLLPLLFWCVDFRVGARIAVLFLLSSFLNVGLKDAFKQPRPFDLEPSVGLSKVEGYGLPSYHSQSAVVVWGSLGAWVSKTWLWVVAVVLILLVSFSRVYLGVHFPTDVLAGWVIGIVLVISYLVLQSRVEKWLAGLKLGIQLALAIVVPVGLLMIHPTGDTTSAMATLTGAGVGFVLTQRYVRFSTGGQWWQRVVRYLIGIGVVLGLYLGLKAVLPGEESALHLIFRFLRYGVIGLWITLGGPWVFCRLRLVAEGEQ